MQGTEIRMTVAPANSARLLARVCLLLAQRGIEVRTVTFVAGAGHRTVKLHVAAPQTTALAVLQNKLGRLIDIIDVVVERDGGGSDR
jgi:acetolactate synthase small subunit